MSLGLFGGDGSCTTPLGKVEASARAVTIALATLATSQGDRPAALAKGVLGKQYGFALLQTTKAAILAGLEVGQGIAVRILEPGKLSAPLFIKSTKVSVGLGVTDVHSAILFSSEADFAKLTSGEATVGTDFNFTPLPWAEPEVPVNTREENKSEGTTHIVSVSESFAPVDVSLSGGKLGPDTELNTLAYGAGVTSDQILSGNAPVPPQLATVYEYLHTRFL